MSDTEGYVKKLARAWHRHIQNIAIEEGLERVRVTWADDTEECRHDLMECFTRLINDGLIPASEDWEWEATFKRMVGKLSEMTPEEHERMLKEMGMKEIKTAWGTFRYIPHPLLKEEKDE